MPSGAKENLRNIEHDGKHLGPRPKMARPFRLAIHFVASAEHRTGIKRDHGRFSFGQNRFIGSACLRVAVEVKLI